MRYETIASATFYGVPLDLTRGHDFVQSSGDLTADRRYSFAMQMLERGDAEAGIDLLRQALEIVPAWAPGHFVLGEALMQNGQDEEAAAVFETYLELDPQDHMGATVKLSLLGERGTPLQLPQAYVHALYEQYAARFEESLVEKLNYAIPWLIAELLDKHHAAAGDERILDLGCGTGLMGQALAARGSDIDGIDLSPAMLAEAEKKGLYSSLLPRNILEWDGGAVSYDIVIASDVFIYMGDLHGIFDSVRRALKPGGLFVFTVQEGADGDFTLGADHRFSQSDAYIKRIAAQAGFNVLRQQHATLRKDAGNDVPGILYFMEAPQGAVLLGVTGLAQV